LDFDFGFYQEFLSETSFEFFLEFATEFFAEVFIFTLFYLISSNLFWLSINLEPSLSSKSLSNIGIFIILSLKLALPFFLCLIPLTNLAYGISGSLLDSVLNLLASKAEVNSWSC